MKLFMRLSLVLLAVLFIGIGALVFFRNDLIAASVEQAGRFAFGVPTPIDNVVTEFGSGRFALEGYSVENPEGFSDQPVFKLDSASMHLPLMSLRGNAPLVIPEVTIAGLGVSIERTGKGFNFSPILERVKGLSDAAGGGTSDEKPASGPGRQIVIQRIVFEDWTLDANFGSGLVLPTQRLDSLVLTNVEAGANGLPGVMGQITEKLLAYATDKIGIEGLSPDLLAQLDELRNRLGQDIPNLDELRGELESQAREQIDSIKDQARDQLDQYKDEAQKQLDALRGQTTGQVEVLEGEAKQQLESLQTDLGDAVKSLGADTKEQLDALIGSVTGEGAAIEGASGQLETLLEQVKDEVALPAETKAKIDEVIENLTQEGAASDLQKKATESLQKGLGGLLGGKKKEQP